VISPALCASPRLHRPDDVLVFAGTQSTRLIATVISKDVLTGATGAGGTAAGPTTATAASAPPQKSRGDSVDLPLLSPHAPAAAAGSAPAAAAPAPVVLPSAQWTVFGAHFGFVYALALHTTSTSLGAGAGTSRGSGGGSSAPPWLRPLTSALPPTVPPSVRVTPPAGPDFRLFSGSGDGTVGVWVPKAKGSLDLDLLFRLEGHTGSVYALEVTRRLCVCVRARMRVYVCVNVCGYVFVHVCSCVR
jgi:hypothetical protein